MQEKTKVLIVDDDMNIAELISLYLDKEGYETKRVFDGKKALEDFEKFAPHLVILDIMLPGLDGNTVLKEIRRKSNAPVIMLTAKGEVFDKVLALEIGADDYLVKPFDSRELSARVKAVLRRFSGEQSLDDTIVYPNLSINLTNYTVIYHGIKLDMPPKELELLHCLASKPNHVFTRDTLLDKIWGYEYIGDTRTIDVHVKRLREKLNKKDNWSIKTVWGVGYKFETEA